jgi:hypothetical protein
MGSSCRLVRGIVDGVLGDVAQHLFTDAGHARQVYLVSGSSEVSCVRTHRSLEENCGAHLP